MKSLAILAVFFAVAQALVPATRQASNQPAKDTVQKQADANSGKNPLLPPRPVVKPNAAPPASESNPNKQASAYQQNTVTISEPTPVSIPWSLHDKIAWVANIALAVGGIIGICIALRSLNVLKKQTRHIVLSERAWVMIATVSGGEALMFHALPKYVWRIKNRGKTPARLIDTGVTCELMSSQLPEIPIYRVQYKLGLRPIAPEGSLEMNTFWGHQTGTGYKPLLPRDVASLTNLRMVAYGYVKYLDVFDNECESRFCESYSWDARNDEPVTFFPLLEETPPAYVKHT
jgi:hypothetical protein